MTIKKWITDKAVCIFREQDQSKHTGKLIYTDKESSSILYVIEPNSTPLIEGDKIMVADWQTEEYEGVTYYFVDEADVLCIVR